MTTLTVYFDDNILAFDYDKYEVVYGKEEIEATRKKDKVTYFVPLTQVRYYTIEESEAKDEGEP